MLLLRVDPYFNPRSREGSDTDGLFSRFFSLISIHAPVKGATNSEKKERVVVDISIHAPVKGATLSCPC